MSALRSLERRALCLAVAALAVTAGSMPAQSGERERIRIVGSASLFPLAVAAAEAFSVKTRFMTPVVEGNGSETGFKLFCAGKGVEHPDIATAERRMTRNELAKCRQRGISVAEIKFGHRGVVLAKSRRGDPLSLTGKQVFQALSRQVPIGGKAVDNPYRLWSDIDFSLPVKPIEVLGPSPTRPDRGTFDALVMAPAAVGLFRLTGSRGDDGPASAPKLRADGVFNESADEGQILDRLATEPDALGIVGFTFLQQHINSLQAVAVDGVVPNAESIGSGSYGPSGPLYLYIKRENIGTIPGIQDYVAEIAGDAASGSGGYLVKRGLIPLPPAARAALAETARKLAPLQM